MNIPLNSDRSCKALREFTISLQGNVSRQAGSIRAVILDGKVLNADRYFGVAKAAQESLNETFGTLEADRKVHELKLDAWSDE